MSLRALKKREFMNPYKKHPIPIRTRKLIESKPNNNLTTNNNNNNNNDEDNQTSSTSATTAAEFADSIDSITIKKRCKSLPNLTLNNYNFNIHNNSSSSSRHNNNDNNCNRDNNNHINWSHKYSYCKNKLLSKSDTDITKLLQNYTNDFTGDLMNAKSEICIKTISVHKTAAAATGGSVGGGGGTRLATTSSNSSLNVFHQGESNHPSHHHSHHHQHRHHHHNSNCSLNGRSSNDVLNNNNTNADNRSFVRRMSGQSLSIYSNRSITNSLNNNDYENHINRVSGCRIGGNNNNNNNNVSGAVDGARSDIDDNYIRRFEQSGGDIVNDGRNRNVIGNRRFIDTSCVLHIPIIGYEVMEERARFTVYKLRVENPFTNDCWLVLRRYTDFVRLNNKLKQAFPTINNLQLPRKKLFGDNFNTVFLDNRVQGLQMFVNSIMSKDELRNSKIVRDFFCLDEPPMYSESMEECRAIFEAQEETISHLKTQINNKNDMILSLQQRLSSEILEKDKLKMALKHITTKCSNCSLLLSDMSISIQSDDEKKCDH